MSDSKKSDWHWVAGKPGTFTGEGPSRFLAPTLRWDANFYVALARVGYRRTSPAGPPYSAAFFPLYPVVVRAIAAVIGDTFWAAFAVSNTAALLAALAMVRLASVNTTSAEGVRAASLLLASPGAHFLSYAYPEALFVLLLTLALVAAALHRPFLAIVPGALATATRSAGVVVTLVLLVRAWEQRREPRAWARWTSAAVLSLAGLVAFSIFCRVTFGDALAFAHIQAFYGRPITAGGPLLSLVRFNVDPDYYVVTIGAIAVSVMMIARTPAWMSVGSWFLVLLPMSTGTLKAMIRYQAANVPLLAGTARIVRGTGFRILLFSSLALMAFEAFLFGKGIGHY